MGNKIASFIDYWFKPSSKPPQQPPPPQLPNDVLALIINKLDMVSLCRCTAASKKEFSHLLPGHVRSMSTPLPPSFLLPEKTTYWYGKFILYIIQKLKHYILTINTGGSGWIRSFFITVVCVPSFFFLFILIHTPRVSPSGRRFFRRLKRLEFVELVLPPPPTADYLTNPDKTWFRWDAKFMENGNYHLIFVIGDIIGNNKDVLYPREINPKEEFFKKAEVVVRHLTFHVFTRMYLSVSENELFFNILRNRQRCLMDSVGDLVSMDAGKNGRLRMQPAPDSKGRNRSSNNSNRGISHQSTVCYVPTSLKVPSNNGGSSMLMKNVWLLFMSGEDLVDDEGGSSVDDSVRGCVNNFEEVDDSRMELKEAVMSILADQNKREFEDAHFWENYES
ncbi:uncharacterized protein [Spinacia oleracea]|uniref:F-box domain-containing protein n=1 Tax=Spinacia oleracea TaxID=3562 RepID=A0ABM3QWF1_SPIOL|nr:uncharacterized protein LOC130462781 [Spinacia oleracea]